MTTSSNIRRLCLALTLALGTVPARAMADGCAVDAEGLSRALDAQSRDYAIASDIDCTAPQLPAHRLICASAADNGLLWQMAQLDDGAYVYAFENATGRETLHDDPPRDAAFIALRDACTDEVCLCAAYITHTGASLGGLSPYQ